MTFRGPWALISETFLEWLDDGVSSLAAGLAFYTVFSLAPILVILLAISGALYGEEAARQQILSRSQELVGPMGAEIVASALEDAHKNAKTATVLGLTAILFGATVAFVNLQDALNAIWSVAPKPGWQVWPFLRKRLLSFLLILGFGLILLLSVLAGTAVSAMVEFASTRYPTTVQYLEAGHFVVWLAILTLSFGVIYKVLPDVKIAWTDVWIGSAVAALLFTAGKTLIGIYLARGTATSAFGAASSLGILLLWIYYSAQILLLCAEFTQVYARRRGAAVIPDDNAVRVVKSYLKAA